MNTTTNGTDMWRTTLSEAMEGPHRAAGAGEPPTASILFRAALAQRVLDAHERAVRQARELVEDAQRLLVSLQTHGVASAVTGNKFAGQARTVSGALIRLGEEREIFQSLDSFCRAERVAAVRALPAASEDCGETGATARGWNRALSAPPPPGLVTASRRRRMGEATVRVLRPSPRVGASKADHQRGGSDEAVSGWLAPGQPFGSHSRVHGQRSPRMRRDP